MATDVSGTSIILPVGREATQDEHDLFVGIFHAAWMEKEGHLTNGGWGMSSTAGWETGFSVNGIHFYVCASQQEPHPLCKVAPMVMSVREDNSPVWIAGINLTERCRVICCDPDGMVMELIMVKMFSEYPDAAED